MTTTRRMSRLFRDDGKTLIVAMDHLSKLGKGVRMRDPGRVLADVAAAGADAALLRQGVITRLPRLGRLGIVLSVGHGPHTVNGAVELALRLGADAIKVEAFPGSETHPPVETWLGALAAKCHEWGMPLIAEMIPVSFEARDRHTQEAMTDVARFGADLGADVVKTKLTADFAEVVALAEVPVIIVGGASGDDRSLFASVREALDAGAAGAAVGRRIFGHDTPGRLAGALARMIHENLGIDEALADVTRRVVGRSGGG